MTSTEKYILIAGAVVIALVLAVSAAKKAAGSIPGAIQDGVSSVMNNISTAVGNAMTGPTPYDWSGINGVNAGDEATGGGS